MFRDRLTLNMAYLNTKYNNLLIKPSVILQFCIYIIHNIKTPSTMINDKFSDILL